MTTRAKGTGLPIMDGPTVSARICMDRFWTRDSFCCQNGRAHDGKRNQDSSWLDSFVSDLGHFDMPKSGTPDFGYKHFSISLGRVAILLVLLGAGAGAAEVGDLYQAQIVVTGQGETNRLRGFALCLEDVVVKVSGDPRLIGDPRLAPLAQQAAALVAGFSYHDQMSGTPLRDEQGTRDRPYDLTVRFDQAKIDAALRGLGIAPWTAARPRLAVLVGMRNGRAATLVSSDDERARNQREALEAAASKRGLPIVLPSTRALAIAGLTVEQLPGADFSRLQAVADATGGDVALVGTLVFVEKSLRWSADWRLAWQGTTYRWRITSTTFDDAFRQAMTGAAQILSGHGKPK